MSQNELTAKIRELKELQALIDQATTEAEAIKDALKAEMTAQNTDEMMVDVFKLRYTPVSTSRFDTTVFKKTHAELYEQYTKQSESRRFSIA